MSVPYPELIDRLLADPGTVFLLGGMDSGKTSFARALLRAAVDQGMSAAYVDTDLDRPLVGPPTTIGMRFVREQADLEDANLAQADALYFVGWISPHRPLLRRLDLRAVPSAAAGHRDGQADGPAALGGRGPAAGADRGRHLRAHRGRVRPDPQVPQAGGHPARPPERGP